jgi:hypothetical protein
MEGASDEFIWWALGFLLGFSLCWWQFELMIDEAHDRDSE